jgi:hypothetical protein
VLLYKGVLQLPDDDAAKTVEKIFETNKWSNAWTNGIFDYHHYHSITHEVLGVVRAMCLCCPLALHTRISAAPKTLNVWAHIRAVPTTILNAANLKKRRQLKTISGKCLCRKKTRCMERVLYKNSGNEF